MSHFSAEDSSLGNRTGWKAKSNKYSSSKPSLSQLPLYYKDKPSYGVKTKKQKIIMLLKGFIASLVLYFIYDYASKGLFSNLLSYSRTSTPTNDWHKVQQEVRDVFLESWDSYETYAWGKDVYHPLSQTGENMGPKPLGWMIVDSLDTLLLMDCKEQFEKAKKWVKEDLDYHFDYNVNVFETTIRMLGGLLSAHHLSEDDLFLDKANDLANALLGGYESKSGVPYSSVNLLTGDGIKNHVDNGASSTAEVSTLQLEMKYLAKLTGEVSFWEKAEKVMKVLDDNKPEDGLVPIYIHPDTGKYQGRLIRLGSRGDSYYEYLLKQYLQTSLEEPIYWDLYRESVDGVKKHLVRKSQPNQLTFVGELENGINGALSPKMDHLVCFYGGLLAVGATNGLSYEEAKKSPNWDEDKESDFKLGEELTHTCYKMYHDVPTGLSPEIVVFNEDPTKNYDFFIKKLDRHNLQRPETVESLFYLYRITGDVKYREWGLEIFQNFVKYTKVVDDNGKVSYTSLNDVTRIPPKMRDNMESFWFAETLKYLYLLFDDDNKIPLDKYVFNTEAHPFPRFELGPLFKTGFQRDADDERTKVHHNPAVQKLADGEKPVAKAPVIDKKNPPKAAPVGKSVEEQALEEVAKDPKIGQDKKEKNAEKLEELIHDLD